MWLSLLLLCLQSAASDYFVGTSFREQVASIINDGIHYWRNEGLLEAEGKAFAEWTIQGDVPTDAQV